LLNGRRPRRSTGCLELNEIDRLHTDQHTSNRRGPGSRPRVELGYR
jgi:hypothetical protein